MLRTNDCMETGTSLSLKGLDELMKAIRHPIDRESQ